jgi:hypothetical protein
MSATPIFWAERRLWIGEDRVSVLVIIAPASC